MEDNSQFPHHFVIVAILCRNTQIVATIRHKITLQEIIVMILEIFLNGGLGLIALQLER